MEPQETAIRWLKMAVEHRNVNYFVSLVQLYPDLPYDSLGKEFLRLALTLSEVPEVAPFWNCEGDLQLPRNWARDMEALFSSITNACRVHQSLYYLDDSVKETGWLADGKTLEHVAALRGDVKLVVWLLEHKWVRSPDPYYDSYHLRPFVDDGRVRGRRMKCDTRGRYPLHLAVVHRKPSIVRAYAESETLRECFGYFPVPWNWRRV